MTQGSYVQYDDETHRAQFFQLNLEHLTWADKESFTIHRININPSCTVKEYLESVFTKFTSIKPPDGIIYILEVDGEAAGMVALRKLEDGVGEIKRMYIRPKFRGRGYGKEMYKGLEEKAREFGFSKLQLDTMEFTAAALHIYRKFGFKERGSYSGDE